MIRVGIIDKFLDNHHTNHYPYYMKLAGKLYDIAFEFSGAWAETDSTTGGCGTVEWCRHTGIKHYDSYDELIAHSDALMVMGADDCSFHEELAQKALKSGKPTFCDKTFTTDLDSAKRMFELANLHNTPIFTCSAQRFCMELLCHAQEGRLPAVHCATTGPGDMVNYSIHQFEMLECAMGVGAMRCKARIRDNIRYLEYEYHDGRTASFKQGDGVPFTITVSDGKQEYGLAVAEYYMNFMHHLLRFFEDKIPPVKQSDTLEIMAMQQAGREAFKDMSKWAEVPRY